MKKILIRRLGVSSIARFVGVVQAIYAFIVAFFVMFGGIAALLANDSIGAFEKFFGSVAIVIVALLVVPLIAFLVGWLYGAVLALIANLFLHTANGIELDVEEEK